MWTGRIPYGKCDIVPGELFVATEFQHIAWLPVIPIRTWVIVEGSIESTDSYSDSFMLTWAGAPIRFSLKSFCLAWLRCLLLLVAIGGLLWLGVLVLQWIGGRRPITETIISLGIIGCTIVGYWVSFRLVFARPNRANFLREILANKYGEQ